MPRGIEADPHVLLRLEGGQRRALRDRVRDARLEVVDADLQVQLPAARLVKESSAEVVMRSVLLAALMICSVFTGPVPGAVHTFTTAVVVKLPTFMTMVIVTSVVR